MERLTFEDEVRGVSGDGGIGEIPFKVRDICGITVHTQDRRRRLRGLVRLSSQILLTRRTR